MNKHKESKRCFFKYGRGLSTFLLIIFITYNIFVSCTAVEQTTPVPSTKPGNFTPAPGWENYNHFNFAEALQKSIYFYDAEKCGAAAGNGPIEWRGACHEGDEKIPLSNTSLSKAFIEKYKSILDPDGDETVDVHGGFHDAGDHVRFGLPQSYAAGTLGWGFLEFREEFKKLDQEEHMLEILKYFSDTFLRCSFLDKDGKLIAFCYMVGEGDLDHSYWGPPELYPANIPRPADFATAETPGSDVCASTSAALCTAYLIFKDSDPEYASRCLTVAKAMYDFAVKYRGKHNGDGYYTSAYDEDELAWAAVWLYECTGDMNYVRDIDSIDDKGYYTGYIKRIIPENFNTNTWFNSWTHCWDVVWAGVFLKLNALLPDDERWDFFARWNIEYHSAGLAKHVDPNDHNYDTTSPAGYIMINGWGSARYNTAAQLCALVYEKYHPERTDFGDWAKGQMEYIMGRNPMGYSYIVGYGYEKGLPFARHVHHRAAHGSKTLSMLDPPEHKHILWGALAGGPDKQDYHQDVTTDFVYNEVAVDYNAAFVGACAGLYKYYGEGQEPIPNFPPKEPKQDDYYCESRIERENTESTQIVLKLHNESSQPPHYETGMMVRYFFNISELLESGQSIEDIVFAVEYDEQISLQDDPIEFRGPFKWDDSGTYYYEFDWSGRKIYGDRELQISMRAKQDSNYTTHWDPSNDYSRKDVTSSYAVNKNVPVYLNGVKVYGEEPPKNASKPTPTVDPRVTPDNNASLKVLYKGTIDGSLKNTIRAAINIKNTGTAPVDLSDVKVRYWFTSDGGQNSFTCEYALIGTEKVTGNFFTIDNAVPDADTYCEIGFTKDAGKIAPGGSSGDIPFRIESTSSYDQTNDYSFDSNITKEFGDNKKITAYVNSTHKYGVEPVTTIKPTPSGYKISGYIQPNFTILPSNAEKLKEGFKVELLGDSKYATTDKNGYFEINGVPSGKSYTLRITKASYLQREIKNIVVNDNIVIGTASSPIAMWAGDTARKGVQDNAINMADIIEFAACFNLTRDNANYKADIDINKDGAINMSDIIIVAKCFNKVSADYPAV
ncbi:glycoside hydrolase family 9 protein [Pseudobacteroides cellulosolvens]|uniref:Cellulase n=1 Tax=Pseudobacteroides cellulosolvens ATCC 35603 = DSM 2933 TaxID=398512 RepID=A0A0L6JHS2_9FIRM|nr:glycoside hydrolase family 9 protein [Pseudobacteroides cellulosolvens]KNY25263.1 Cellulase [Pseudobacteroides cellulosolvens ATCC 35603 = DSM 2933]